MLSYLEFGEFDDPATDRLRLAQAYYDASYPPSLFTGGAPADPHISSLSPNTGTVGTATPVTVNGANFAADAEVEVNGEAIPTTFVAPPG